MISVKLVSYTQNPEMAIAIAARTCISDMEYEDIHSKLKEDDVQRILKTVILKKHHNVLEHANFTFSISGISRILTHQLVRHRIASYSQLSQQRTDSSQLQFTVPPEIQKQPQLAEEYQNTMMRCQELYRSFIRCGISKGSARYVLPSGFHTRIVTTINARSLFNLLSQRECAFEDWEFQKVSRLMHNELMKVAPVVFQFAGPPCETGEYELQDERCHSCPRYKKITFHTENSHTDIKAQPICK